MLERHQRLFLQWSFREFIYRFYRKNERYHPPENISPKSNVFCGMEEKEMASGRYQIFFVI